MVLRRRFAIDDRTFTVLGDAWFDAARGGWTGRFLFVPLDRSLPRGVAAASRVRSARRNDVERRLRAVSDRALASAWRAVAPPAARARRGR